MLSLAPWMVPLGIILVALFVSLCVFKLEAKTEMSSDFAATLVVVCASVILMAFGSLLTIWIL